MKSIIFFLAIALASCGVSRQPNRYCVVVDQVKYGKTIALIKPKSFGTTGSTCWYYYRSLNVQVGDTVEVSVNDRKQPKF